MPTIFIEYPKCSTCKKAKDWLKQNNIKFEERNINANSKRINRLDRKKWTRYKEMVQYKWTKV